MVSVGRQDFSAGVFHTSWPFDFEYPCPTEALCPFAEAASPSNSEVLAEIVDSSVPQWREYAKVGETSISSLDPVDSESGHMMLCSGCLISCSFAKLLDAFW
jgi:hypothetical protein